MTDRWRGRERKEVKEKLRRRREAEEGEELPIRYPLLTIHTTYPPVAVCSTYPFPIHPPPDSLHLCVSR
ncbi:hypothetical protein E2C01_090560 [Portunus trituberculatus]|uniref:Uncharacterized protein n=1 Tax=Portunus trituberculatus TaxID=210409 RepID=A0A5B7JLQ6_PORTR|nr:hypothetical protein [Portunus trituberculatus]